jgi:hypothetical protein
MANKIFPTDFVETATAKDAGDYILLAKVNDTYVNSIEKRSALIEAYTGLVTVGTGGEYATINAAVTAGKYRMLIVGNVTIAANITIPNTAIKIEIFNTSFLNVISFGAVKFTGGGANLPTLVLDGLKITNTAGVFSDFTGFITLQECRFVNSATISSTANIENTHCGATTGGTKTFTLTGSTKSIVGFSRTEAAIVAGTSTEIISNPLF